MKKLACCLLMLGLGVFAIGCGAEEPGEIPDSDMPGGEATPEVSEPEEAMSHGPQGAGGAEK